MKTKNSLTILLAACMTITILALAQNVTPPYREQLQTKSVPETLVFNQFVQRAENCKGMFSELEKWFKVIKPELQHLGYSSREIADLKTRLSSGTPTLDDARLFSEKWLAYHGEQLDPKMILQLLATDLPRQNEITSK